MHSNIDFIKGDTRQSLLKMVVPLLVSMILTMVYNLVDSLWVGNLLGEQGYAALTNSTAIIMILNAVAMGAGNGVSILVSQAVGAGEKEKLEKIIVSVTAMTVVFAGIITLVVEIGLEAILRAMGTPEEIRAMSYDYLAVYLSGFVILSLYLHFAAIFRAFGDPLFQVKGMLLSTVINAVIDPLFIQRMGLRGAAVATVLSECLCLVFVVIYHKKKKWFRMDFKKVSLHYIKPVFAYAVPSALQQCMPAISSAVMVILVTRFGVTTLAAYGVTSKLEILLFYPAMAMNMALTTIVGQCRGGGFTDRVKDYRKCAVRIGGGFMTVLSLLVIVLSGQLSQLFVRSGEVAGIVKQFFCIVSIGYVLYMITSCLLGELSGMGKPGISMMLMLLYYLVIRVPLAILLMHTGLGLCGIWTAILISHILAAVLAGLFVLFQGERKEQGYESCNCL